MSWIHKLKYLLPSRRRELDQDMREEFESVAAMAGPRGLGNLTLAAEGARSVWGWGLVEEVWRDLQYAARTMRHSPGFTATAVLSLALGIGANTAIFSLIDALMLRWLPVSNPQELVQLKRLTPGEAIPGDSFSYAIVKALEQQEGLFAGVAGFSLAPLTTGPLGSRRNIPGAWVTGDYYGMLGLDPVIGRLLTREDDAPGAPLVAVISYSYWERELARRADVIGQSIPINGVPVTIVGISPPEFAGTTVGLVADITLPVAALPQLDTPGAPLLGPGTFWLRVLARPKAGVSVAQAKSRIDALWPGIAEQATSPNWPAARRRTMAQVKFELAPGGTGYTYMRQLFRKPLLVLMVVVGLVLLIACANVANLLLARATVRQREIAVRLSIGAGRARLIRQLLTESLFLSLMGAALGVGVAWMTSRVLVQTQSVGSNYAGGPALALDVTPNWHVLAFTAVIAVATGVLFGLMPAFQATAAGPLAGLKDDARRTRTRALGSLVSVQVALSLLLLVGAGLFVKTLQNLTSVDKGFRQEGVLLVDFDGQREGYEDDRLAQFNRDLLDRARRAPGVASASLSGNTPMSGGTWTEAALPKGEPLPEHDTAIFIATGPQYFQTLGTPIVAGRDFQDADENGPMVAMIDETYATRHFAGRNPVGQYLSARLSRQPVDLQIIGVVKTTATEGLRRAPYPTVYLSYFQKRPANGGVKFAPGTTTLEIRASGSMSRVAAAVLKELQPQLPSTPLEIRAMSDQVARTMVQENLMARLASGFGGLGLLLACVGLYGLLAYGVARRTKEIGVRMALGAQRGNVQRMVLRGALRPVVVGMALGLPSALVASRWIQSMLFGLKATDPWVFVTATMVLGACGLVVAYFPARRASRVDPMMALRHE